MAEMSNEHLVSYLSDMASKGLKDIGSGLSNTRSRLLSRYHGKATGKVKAGGDYSKYNTEEIFETVQRILAPMIKALVSGRGVVSFHPLNERDILQSNFESKVVNHLILNANGGSGYLALYSYCFEAALYPNSYIYADVEVDSEPKGRRELDLTAEELEGLLSDPKITLKETLDIKEDEENGVELFDVLVEEESEITRLVFMPIPPEDVVYRAGADSPLLDDLNFKGVRFIKTRSELLQANYDKATVNAITPLDDLADDISSERLARLNYTEQDIIDPTSNDEVEPFSKAEKEYVLWKFWLNIDYDGDGVSEFREIHVAGDKVLLNEITDYCPLGSMSLMINPHTHVGRSPAQAVEPLSRLRTAVTRTFLDNNIYGGQGKTFLNIRSIIPGDTTTNALYSRSVPYVFVQGDPGQLISKIPAEKDFSGMMAFMDSLKEEAALRTGAPLAQLPEINQLNNVKSGAMESALKQTSERTELLIRTAAETGFRSLGRLVHKLCRKHPDLIRQIQIDGQWQDVNANRWPEREDISVKVGLGFSDPDKVVQNMSVLFPILERMVPMHLVGHEQLYNALGYLIEALDMGSADYYLANPIEAQQSYQQAQQQAAEQPDPNTMVAEATVKDVEYKQQREMQKLDITADEKRGKLQIELEKLKQAAEAQDLSAVEITGKIAKVIADMEAADAASSTPKKG